MEEVCCSEKPTVGVAGDNHRQEAVKEDEQTLKEQILRHPLFGLLIETHFNCVKVGLGVMGDTAGTNEAKEATNSKLKAVVSPDGSSDLELDHFMEAYCTTLNKLKEAMEDSMQGTSSFIQAMYNQLRELNETNPNDPKPGDCCAP